ncbi:MAG: DUF2059 domain-containing protein [Xanthobacteraceae bacterium]|nr:DUF2059 domain-containing protein [Xanthobacteraceae bacterium]
MSIVRALAAVAVAAFAFVPHGLPPAAAQNAPSPAALQAARTLTDLMADSIVAPMTQGMTEQMWPTLEAALRQQNPNVEAKELADLRRELEDQQRAAMRESIGDIAAIYARHFTVDELQALAAFYRTPAGTKLLRLMPTVSVELMAAMGPRMQALQAKVDAAVAKVAKLPPTQPGTPAVGAK